MIEVLIDARSPSVMLVAEGNSAVHFIIFDLLSSDAVVLFFFSGVISHHTVVIYSFHSVSFTLYTDFTITICIAVSFA